MATDLAQYDIFKYKGDLDIRSSPPTRDALVLHTHRAAYISEWIWAMYHITNATEESPLLWGWSIIDDNLMPLDDARFKCDIQENIQEMRMS